MKKIYLQILALFFPLFFYAQDYYFPPLSGDEWETISPADAGFCDDQLDTLYSFLEEKNTKAFIILKDGKIAVEQYFDDFGQDSLWYWASAGKTITGLLIGIAQEEGLLNIEDKTSDYLGSGWTSLASEKEDLIKIKHQLAMTTGMDDGVPDPNCLDASCLVYLEDAGNRWSYHNAPYRLLQDVIENASNQTLNVYTFQKLQNKIGMGGTWFNRVFFSKPRHMARFGSLIINQGNWDGTQVLGDQNFLSDMVNTSNNFNSSYGYLWWLNGKGSYMLPSTQLVFNTDLVPNAPAEMYSALGKNDQKLYILPSQNIAVVRMGDASGDGLLALSSFDNELWGYLDNLFCESNSTDEVSMNEISIFPNPVNELLQIRGVEDTNDNLIQVFNILGQKVECKSLNPNQIDVAHLSEGNYFLRVTNKKNETIAIRKFIKVKN